MCKLHTLNSMLCVVAIFSKIWSPQRVDCLAPYGSIDVKCPSEGHNDTLPSSETESRADNLRLTNNALIR